MKRATTLFIAAASVWLANCAAAPHRSNVIATRTEPPLAGRIWDVGAARFIDPTELAHQLEGAHFVLLGEVHDSPDAHRHQAEMVDALVAQGRHPALVFEMFDADTQPTIDRVRAASPHDADAIATALDFTHSGWDWASYRPLVASALEHGLAVVAGNVPHADARALAMHGLDGFDPARAEQLGLTQALSPDVQTAMRDELRESHCGMLPESMLDGMALAQRARDATMAARMLATSGDRAVLITGAGHARTDRGVPVQLRSHDANASVRSVAFVEVIGGRTNPSAYAERYSAASLPFDDVWFVPPVERREDMCASLRHRAH